MKKTKNRAARKGADELRDEYRFDYSKAKPNRFAAPLSTKGRMILLDEDVANAFPSSESVNALLRALLRNLPNPVSWSNATESKQP